MSPSSKWHGARRALVALPLAALTLASGCGYLFVSFDFDREVELAPGEVRGVVVRRDLDDLPAPFSAVVVEGGAVRRTGADGRFTIKGLTPGAFVLRAADDVDGDGFAERTALVSAVVRAGAPVSIVPGDDTPVVSSVLLGAVRVDGTSRVAGRLFVDEAGTRRTPEAAGLIGRVVVTREFDLPTADDEIFDLVTLGSEADAAVDGDGEFSMPSVGTGTFQLIAFLFEPAPDGSLGALVGASIPVKVRGVAGETIDLKETPFVVERGAGIAVRPVQIPLVPAVDVDAYAVFGPPGLELPPCDVSPPDVYPAPFAHVRRTPVSSAEGELLASLPVGLFDVAVCTVDGPDGPRGVLYQLAVAADPDGAAQLTAPVTMQDGDPCGDPALPDCDGDGQWGLPTFSPASQARWATCVAQCQAAFGAVGAERRCRIDDDLYDCDDDGDGQPDVTEDPACVGLGRGTDLDGDGLCSGQDPFPRCRANNATDCPASAPEFELDVPDAYEGGAIGEGVFDGTFGNGGRVVLTDADGTEQFARALAPLEDGGLLVVGSVFDNTEIRVWRLDANGALVDAFGTSGVLSLAVDDAGAPLFGEAVDVIVDQRTGDAFVLLRLDDDASRQVVGLLKVIVDTGLPDPTFGDQGVLLIDVATFGATPGADPANDRPSALMQDAVGNLYIAGSKFTPGGDDDIFVCALSEDGQPLDTFITLTNPGACFVEQRIHHQTVFDALLKDDDTFIFVGEEQSIDASFIPRALLTVRTLDVENPPWFETVTTAFPGEQEARAHAVIHDVEEGATYAVGRLDDRAVLWRADEFSSDIVLHSPLLNSAGEAVARDASGNVFLAGSVDPESTDPEFLIARYSSSIQQFTVVAHPDSGAGEAISAAAFDAFVDGDGRLVLAGGAIPEGEPLPDVISAAVWRLNPIGPNIVVDQEPNDGGTGEIGFDAGGDLGCVQHVDCILGDPAVDCGGSDLLVPMCAEGGVCVCDDPCLAVYEPFDAQGTLVLASAADNPVPSGTSCIIGNVLIQGYTDTVVGDSMALVQRIQGNLTVQSNAITELDLALLEIVNGDVVIQNNTALFGPAVDFLPRLRWVDGLSLNVIDNPELPTVYLAQLVDRLETSPSIQIAGNGCTSDILDTSCELFGEQCLSDPTYGFVCEFLE